MFTVRSFHLYYLIFSTFSIENNIIIYCRTNHIRVSLPVRLYDVADTVPPVIFPLVSSPIFFIY